MEWHLRKSGELFAASRQVIPGGVNSPVRSFSSVGGPPPFITRGEGCRLHDVDGHVYIDYCLSWGPLVAGHAHPEVVAAISAAAARGTSFGAPTELELAMAQSVIAMVPSMEMVRMVNSGTEATMSAIRLARAATGRTKIIKFTGCYHGHHDSLLVKTGSGAIDIGVPDSPGVPAGAARETITVPYNDLDAVTEVFRRQGEEIAGVIVEPVAANMGLVLPKPDFLPGLRRLTREFGALLILDEVLTGFRVALGGAQAHFDIDSDLTTLGKVIGGGLPVGAYGGKRRYMELVAPAGPMYQAGTLSGNPLAMSAGLATLQLLNRPGAFVELERKTRRLAAGLQGVVARLGLPYRVRSIGSLWGFFFSPAEVTDFESAMTADTAKYRRFFHAMLQAGHYLAPSQFETGFVSLVHGDDELDQTVEASQHAFAAAERQES